MVMVRGMSTHVELPDLAEGSSPLQFGDWLHLAGPIMKDISGCADWWWGVHVGVKPNATTSSGSAALL